jgi:hypothetical protein
VKRLIAGAVIAGVAVFAGTAAFDDNTTRDATGAIIEGGGLGAFVIPEGDCINLPEENLVESLEAVPCSQSHDAEVYHLFDMTGASFPGDSAVGDAAAAGCFDAFHPFVGKAYEYSELHFNAFMPNEDSWNEVDDREIACLIVTLDSSKLTGSMRGSGR